MPVTLVKTDKYNGKYVALNKIGDSKVISSGKNASRVHSAAKKKGHKNPIIFFVPEKDTAHLY
jgi:hypothetical protein